MQFNRHIIAGSDDYDDRSYNNRRDDRYNDRLEN